MIIYLIKIYVVYISLFENSFNQNSSSNRDTTITKSLLNTFNKCANKDTNSQWTNRDSETRIKNQSAFSLSRTIWIHNRITLKVQSSNRIRWFSSIFLYFSTEIVMTALCKVAAFRERKFQSFDCSSWFTFAPYVLHLIIEMNSSLLKRWKNKIHDFKDDEI